MSTGHCLFGIVRFNANNYVGKCYIFLVQHDRHSAKCDGLQQFPSGFVSLCVYVVSGSVGHEVDDHFMRCVMKKIVFCDGFKTW